MPGFVYLVNGLSYFAISLISFFIFLIWLRKKNFCSLGKAIGINGIFYLIPSLLNFLWFSGKVIPTQSDFILILGSFNAVNATILFALVYELVNNKGLLHFLFLFLLTALAIPFSFTAFFLLTSFVSYLLILIVFLDLALFSNAYLKGAGYFGISYSIISLAILGLGVFLNKEPFTMYWFISNVAVFLLLYLFYKDIKSCGKETTNPKPKIKKIILPILFIKFIIFIISISAFIFISTIAVHELGHALSAQYYGCERSKAVIYDILGPPHTEMACDGYYNNTIITFGGLISTIALALIFLFTGGRFTTIMSYLIFGYSLLIAYGDLMDYGVSLNIITVVLFISFSLIVTAIIQLSIFYIGQQKGFYERKKDIEELKPEDYFWLDEKTSIKDLYELVEVLHSMDNLTFRKYVNEEKNDFSKWIRDIFKDEELANNLLKTTDKKEMLALILMKLLKEQGEYSGTILKFICYPLLRDKTNIQQK